MKAWIAVNIEKQLDKIRTDVIIWDYPKKRVNGKLAIIAEYNNNNNNNNNNKAFPL